MVDYNLKSKIIIRHEQLCVSGTHFRITKMFIFSAGRLTRRDPDNEALSSQSLLPLVSKNNNTKQKVELYVFHSCLNAPRQGSLWNNQILLKILDKAKIQWNNFSVIQFKSRFSPWSQSYWVCLFSLYNAWGFPQRAVWSTSTLVRKLLCVSVWMRQLKGLSYP